MRRGSKYTKHSKGSRGLRKSAKNSAFSYRREYRAEYGLSSSSPAKRIRGAAQEKQLSLADIEAMTKEELVFELVKAKIAEARLKKGYVVKGDGLKKEYIALENLNIE